jgi:hypothetical protein
MHVSQSKTCSTPPGCACADDGFHKGGYDKDTGMDEGTGLNDQAKMGIAGVLFGMAFVCAKYLLDFLEPVIRTLREIGIPDELISPLTGVFLGIAAVFHKPFLNVSRAE